MKRVIVVGLVVLTLAIGSLLLRPVQGWLVAAWLPAFPQWSDSRATLAVGDRGEIHYPTSTVFDLDVLLGGMQDAIPTTGLGYLALPDDASDSHPVPAMVILPGSGGIQPGREDGYAALLAEHGIASFIVEYYEPRGMTPDYAYTLRAGSVTDFDVVTDAYSALKLLSTHPGIDPDRIGVMGFSYGGMAVRHAIDARIHEALAPATPGFALFVDFYGPCFQDIGTTRTNGAPLLALRGTADASNDLADCARREAELRAIGVPVERHTFEGAGHAWENAEPQRVVDSPYIVGCEIEYDAQGFARLDGERITEIDPGTPRRERLAARFLSNRMLQPCVRWGYTVGRNEEAAQRGHAALLGFLERHFRLVP
ncbi:MAG: dienelactone hydrolase family protein [Myxococcota bacterium]